MRDIVILNSIDIKLLNNIEENIVDLILATVKRLPKNKQDEFNACDFEKEELPIPDL